MENEPLEDPGQSAPGLPVSQAASGVGPVSDSVYGIMRRTRPWVRFVAVMIMIATVLNLLSTVVQMTVMRQAVSATGLGGAMGGVMIASLVFGILISLLYLYPSLKLWGYANRIRDLGSDRNQLNLAAALGEHRKVLKFVGILALIGIAFFCVAMVVGIVAGISSVT